VVPEFEFIVTDIDFSDLCTYVYTWQRVKSIPCECRIGCPQIVDVEGSCE
jgi:hypothetical protein